MAEISYAPLSIDLMDQIATLTIQVQENNNKFIALEEENHALCVEVRTMQEQNQRFSTVELAPQQPHDSRSRFLPRTT